LIVHKFSQHLFSAKNLFLESGLDGRTSFLASLYQTLGTSQSRS